MRHLRHPGAPLRRAAGRLSLFLLVAGCSAPPAGATIQAAPRASAPALPDPAPISAEEYAQRRAGVAAAMDDGISVAFGSPEPELDYLPYAQNAPFRYLTGILEPDAGLVMVKSGGGLQEILFVRQRNPERELWEGTRLGPEGAAARTGIPARTSDQLVAVVDSLLASHAVLHLAGSAPPDPARGETLSREQQIVAGLLARHPATQVRSLNEPMRLLRARKSPAELDMIRRASHISVLAHREAMRSVAPGMNEFEIQALVEFYFRRNGAERPAYSSIVGSGPNSTTLHYREADRFMQDGEVLLMDVGASYRGYAADVTRTMPVNGRFSADQRAIYETVLEAQKAAEARIRVGGGWQEVNAAANEVIARGLARIGLIDSPDATYDCGATQGDGAVCPQFRLFYMHGLGHGVGLDVHDPDISTFDSFQAGSAFTIEPGIYVRADVLDYLPQTPANRAMIQRLAPVVARFRDIGVRIEDVYLITEEGVERASSGVPREIAEIEALMAEPGLGERDRRQDVVDWYRATTPRR
jgi:Xaa-Pro aminopeptidase